MKETVIIQKLIQVGQMLERGQLEYSGAEADTIYLLDQYAALRQSCVVGRSEQLVCEYCGDNLVEEQGDWCQECLDNPNRVITN